MMEIVHPIIEQVCHCIWAPFNVHALPLRVFFAQIMSSMEEYFPKCVHGSTRYRNDNEPHLVKYVGEAHEGVCAAHQGVCMHTDSADITVGCLVSRH
jgi:hypothetical protein